MCDSFGVKERKSEKEEIMFQIVKEKRG